MCVVYDVCWVVCDVCGVVLCGCAVWCVVCCGVLFLPFAPAVCYSKRGPNIKEYWEIPQKKIILAKCPNTVWVLHREKVVSGVVLSCYVVLCSRVVMVVYISRVFGILSAGLRFPPLWETSGVWCGDVWPVPGGGEAASLLGTSPEQQNRSIPSGIR